MSLAKIILAAAMASFALPVQPGRAERLVATPDGFCLAGPHEAGRIRRLPGAPAMSDRPPNPAEEPFVHCSEASAGDRPASTGTVPRTRR